MVEIGKINKPEVEQYKNRKKIYFVRNLYLPKNATDQYKMIFDRYWKEVEEYIAKLEVAGKVVKIFCESLYMSGEDAKRILKSMNVALDQFVLKKIDAGAELLPLESAVWACRLILVPRSKLISNNAAILAIIIRLTCF